MEAVELIKLPSSGGLLWRQNSKVDWVDERAMYTYLCWHTKKNGEASIHISSQTSDTREQNLKRCKIECNLKKKSKLYDDRFKKYIELIRITGWRTSHSLTPRSYQLVKCDPWSLVLGRRIKYDNLWRLWNCFEWKWGWIFRLDHAILSFSKDAWEPLLMCSNCYLLPSKLVWCYQGTGKLRRSSNQKYCARHKFKHHFRPDICLRVKRQTYRSEDTYFIRQFLFECHES